MTVKIAIIGCGRIAEHHCKAIKENPNLELIAVSDIVYDKSAHVGSKFGVAYYQNYRKMLDEHPEISVVAIITPSGMHYEHSKEIMVNYGKHVVIEKPTVLKYSDLVDLYNISESKGLKIFPVFQNRFNSAVQRVKRGILNGELGDIRLVSVRVRWCRPQRYYDLSPWRGTYSMDGGCLTNQGIHHIDLLRYLGGEIEGVSIRTETLGSDIEVEDVAVGSLVFENKALGSLEITTAARPMDYEASISIVGSKGLAQIGGIAVNELQIYTPNESECEIFSEDFADSVYGNGHMVLYKNIFEVLTNNSSEFIISKDDNLKTIKLLNALYSSDESNSWISLSSSFQSSRLGRYDKNLIKLYTI